MTEPAQDKLADPGDPAKVSVTMQLTLCYKRPGFPDYVSQASYPANIVPRPDSQKRIPFVLPDALSEAMVGAQQDIAAIVIPQAETPPAPEGSTMQLVLTVVQQQPSGKTDKPDGSPTTAVTTTLDTGPVGWGPCRAVAIHQIGLDKAFPKAAQTIADVFAGAARPP